MENVNTQINTLDSNIGHNSLTFTNENKEVWSIALKRREEFLRQYSDYIVEEYIEGFTALGFSPDEIPDLKFLNQALETTGWRVIYVDGYLEQHYYAELLSNKIAPISIHLRSKEFLEYAPGPDMLHDIFGHLPMLFSENYSNYINFLGQTMQQYHASEYERRLYALHIQLAQTHEKCESDSEEIQSLKREIQDTEKVIDAAPPIYTLLGHFFMWTIEFGIINRGSKLQMYGAGLLSSENEAKNFCLGQSSVLQFTNAAVKMGYNFSNFQNQYYFSYSFNDLKNELNALLKN